jgi:hypothetical protein
LMFQTNPVMESMCSIPPGSSSQSLLTRRRRRIPKPRR